MATATAERRTLEPSVRCLASSACGRLSGCFASSFGLCAIPISFAIGSVTMGLEFVSRPRNHLSLVFLRSEDRAVGPALESSDRIALENDFGNARVPGRWRSNADRANFLHIGKRRWPRDPSGYAVSVRRCRRRDMGFDLEIEFHHGEGGERREKRLKINECRSE